MNQFQFDYYFMVIAGIVEIMSIIAIVCGFVGKMPKVGLIGALILIATIQIAHGPASRVSVHEVIE